MERQVLLANGTVLCAIAAIPCNDCFYLHLYKENHDVIAGVFVLFGWDLPQQLARNAANALEKAPGKQG
jgi:hypothetical protein